ncbi:MAG TPA: flagellar biosynthetic protein FliR [Vicinamibacterales bacterium]
MIDLAVVERFALLVVRPGAVVMVAPGFAGTHIPAPVKVGLTVMIALGLLPSVVVPRALPEVSLALVIAREVAIGLSLAFVLRALIAGAELAGHLSGQQIGFNYGATIDPQSGVRNNMLATLYGSLATLGFLAINGHHQLLRALAASYEGLPIGIGHINPSIVQSVRDIFALVFIVGARLAAPIVIVLLIVELAVGLISRAAPSLSFMVIGYPIRIVVGLLLLAALIGTIPAVTNSLLEAVLMTGANTARAFR